MPLVRKAEVTKPSAREKTRGKGPRVKGSYRLPPTSLLDTPPSGHAQIDEAALERSARVLEQKLADFRVQGQVVEVQPGPGVTMYKLQPRSGITVTHLVHPASDLSP